MVGQSYDAIVIGSGQAGNPLAIALAKAGWQTAIIEREHIGGTCVNVGCTPTKTMVASARVAYLSRRSAVYGAHSGPVTVNMAEVRRRKQQIVDSFRNSGLRGIEQTKGLDLLQGEASFTSPGSIEVRMKDGEARLITGKKIFINTGCHPTSLSVQGLDRITTLDSSSIMELDTLPGHLLVIGGGYVGLEFGQMFRRFGSEVTILHRGNHLLSREDSDVADEVTKILTEDGVKLQLNCEVMRAEEAPGKIMLIVKTPEGEATLQGSHLLVAVGRRPNTESLNLGAAGVEMDKRGFIKVDDRLETSAAGVYALGDVKGGPAFTHISYDDFRIIRSNLLEGANVTTKGRLVPYTVFIDPQLGRVGITETEAREQGFDVRVARLTMDHVARAIEVSEIRGFIKVVVDAKTKQILGCAVLSLEGGELMSMLEIAMIGQLPYPTLKEAIFAHPTLAESLNNVFLALDA